MITMKKFYWFKMTSYNLFFVFSGWINGAQHSDDGHAAVAGMMFVCAALFTLQCILKIFLLRKVSIRENEDILLVRKGIFNKCDVP